MHRSSGDLSADRRYRYAQDLLKERDTAAAADLFRQTLEIAPDWAPAWFGLGEACEAEGDAAGAIDAFRRTLALDPADVMGAKPRLARLGAADAADAMTPAYVAALFDEYAPRFDTHLTGALDYRGPEIVMAALRAACEAERRAVRFGPAMDLGCGTGLMGEAVRAHVVTIDGVDLSLAMVELARARGIYRELYVGDAVGALSASSSLPLAGREAAQPPGGGRATTAEQPSARPPPDPALRSGPPSPQGGGRTSEPYELILAADVLVYVGELRPLFEAVSGALTPGGFFAFTTQAHDGEGFALGPDLRFGHSASYIRAMAQSAKLEVVHLTDCATRCDAGRPVPGHVAVVKKADG